MSVRCSWKCSRQIRRFYHQPSKGSVRWNSSVNSSSTGTDKDRKVVEPDKEEQEGAPSQPPLKLLSRPLGVHEPPKAAKWTWKDTHEELIDDERRIKRRNQLAKEGFTKGYYHDLNRALKYHGGKTWIAPQVMIREDKALYFPNVHGTSLDTGEEKHTTNLCAGRVSVVAFINSQMSQYHVEGFITPVNKQYLSHPLYQFIQINLQEQLFKSLFVSLLMRSIAQAVPRELHPTYLVSRQNMDRVREEFGLDNKHVGYVYLVDQNLKVRWAGCGDAKQDETEALYRCTGVLLKRLTEQSAGHKTTKTVKPPLE